MYRKTVISVAIHKTTESPVYGDSTTVVSLDDEGAGRYVRIKQPGREGEVALDPEEIDLVAQAAKQLLEEA